MHVLFCHSIVKTWGVHFNVMEKLTNNPGLQHVSEEIFLNLTFDCLEKCQDVDESWKSILKDPLFWLKKCIQNGHLKETKNAWKKAVQIARGTNMEECVMEHLKNVSKNSWTFFINYDETPINWALSCTTAGGHFPLTVFPSAIFPSPFSPQPFSPQNWAIFPSAVFPSALRLG